MNERHTQRVLDVLGLDDASAVISVSRPNQATARVQLTAEQSISLKHLMESWLVPEPIAKAIPQSETFESTTFNED